VGASYYNTRESFKAGIIYAKGGASGAFVGGDGGSVKISADEGSLVAPTEFRLAGGVGTSGNTKLYGNGGNVTISALGTDGDLFFDSNSFVLSGNGDITLNAGKSLVMQYRAYDVLLGDDNETVSTYLGPVNLGGVVVSLNVPETDQTLSQNNRGKLSMNFSQTANGDWDYSGSGSTAGLYMPSNAYILSNGGNVVIRGGNVAFAGNAVLSGITTSGADVNGGNVTIFNQASGDLGNVILGSSIDTFGGTPVLPTYGRAGGSVTISGRDITVRRIDTHGSASLATATAPAIGGAGGNVELTAAQGGTIILKRDLLAYGGQGFGVGDATGGAGGNVTLVGNVNLQTGDPTRPSVKIDTMGGLGKGDGEAGQGGNISWSGGQSGGLLQGTPANSNALDLRYGSGLVTLGSGVGDTIDLGELITAADDARSTGLIQVNAYMDSITTLTTYARGYNLALLNGGTVETPTTFLNTGYVQIGNPSTFVTTTFAGGINTQSGPTATILAGKLQTSNELLDSEASILLGAVQLYGPASLDTFGNTLVLGSVDSIESAYNLTLLAGIGNGTVQLGGNFGGNVGKPSELGDGTELVAPGTITLAADWVRSSPIVFTGSVNADSIQSLSATPLEFRQTTRLSGNTDINGNVTLNNVSGTASVMEFNLGDGSLLGGAVTLKSLNGGSIKMGGSGVWGVNGAIAGSPNLTLGGVGTRNFNGSVSVARLTLEDPATQNFFQSLSASTITQTGGPVAFYGGVTTLGASSFGGTATLSGMTFSAGGTTTIANLILGGSGVSLVGQGAYTVTALTANGVALTLGGSRTSTKTFNGIATGLGLVTLKSGSGAVSFANNAGATGFVQESQAGALVFIGTVTTASSSTFSGAVTLGSGFEAGGQTTFATGGTVTLGSNLSLSGSGPLVFNTSLVGNDKTLSSTATSLTLAAGGAGMGTFTVSGGNTTVGGSLGVAGLNQAGGTLALNATVTVGGGSGTALFSGGMATLSGIQLNGLANIQGGNVSSSGNTTIGGLVTYGSGDLTSTGGLLTLASGLSLANNFLMDGFGGYSVAGVTGSGWSLTLADTGAKSFTGNIGSSGARLTSFTQSGGRMTLSGGAYTSGVISLNGLTVSGSAVVLDTTSASANGIVLGSGGVQGSGNLALYADGLAITGTVANGGSLSATRSGVLALGATADPYLTVDEMARIQSSAGATFTSLNGDVSSTGVSFSRNLTLNSATGDVNVSGTAVAGALSVLAEAGTARFTLPLSTAQSLSLSADNVSGLENIRTGTFGSVNLSSTAPVIYTSPGNLVISSGNLNFGSSPVVFASTGGTIISNAGNVNPFSGSGDISLYSLNLFDRQLQGAFIPGATFVKVGAADLGGLSLRAVGGLSLRAVGGGSGTLTVYYDNLNNFLPYASQFTTGTGQPYVLATQNGIPGVMTPVKLSTDGAFASGESYTDEEMEMMTPSERGAVEVARKQQTSRTILERRAGNNDATGVPTDGRVPQAKNSGFPAPLPTAQVTLEGKPLASKMEKVKGDADKLPKSSPGKAVADGSPNLEKILEMERLAAEVNVGSSPVAGTK
jgi:hypothetical protein